ncbi:CDP-glycerol glycerophosphotransferase family protein [Microlunatus sp. GCM10028923]|uniref:CDP-glycerol glycerophosphotransferase family protein n=1 Tax=Microlunatus sp. GCM10028923 TaxID=3273400 RepID=UPI00360B1953
MVSLLRRAVPDLPLAVAAGLLVIMVAAFRSGPSPALVIGVGLGLLSAGVIALSRPLARAGSRPQLGAVRLPGHPDPGTPVTLLLTRLVAGLILALSGAAAATGLIPVMILVGVIGIVLAGALLQLVRRRARTVGNAARTRAAIETYAPRVIIYTSRESGGAYQLAMWLPLLDRLGERYLVVVRHPAALAWAAPLTAAPVVCAPLATDLDAVVTESARVALYVNVVGGNANLVGYRSLRHVYLGHGDSDKEASVHPTHRMFDRIFVAGPAARDRYRQAGLEVPDDRFVEIGRPQLAEAATLAGPIGSVTGPTVLLAPTWRGYNARTELSSLPYCLTLAEALIARGATVAFRPHPLSWDNAAERALIDRVDALLARDRTASGRPHRPAGEHRRDTLIEAFNASDALVTDVGGLLVDYFATLKPYAVVLSAATPTPPATAEAGYLVTHDQLRAGDLDSVLEPLLRTDPNASRRPEVAARYLGPLPPSETPFLAALRAQLDLAPRP